MKAVGAHPGWASTNLQSHAPSKLENGLMAIGNRLLAQSGDMGALPTLYAATQDLPGDAYIGPGGPGELRGHPAPGEPQRRGPGRGDRPQALGALRAADQHALRARRSRLEQSGKADFARFIADLGRGHLLR